MRIVTSPAHGHRRRSAVSIARGRTNAEIAAELHISLSTVKAYIGRPWAKLGARNRVEAIQNPQRSSGYRRPCA